jgi:MGT family glycosyltransferase
VRALFTTLPAAGAFHPLVPLAQALTTAGHEVAFATSQLYCSTVEATGYECFPAGHDWLISDREPLYASVRAMVGNQRFSPLRDVYATFLPSRMIDDVLALTRSWQPDVIVREPMEFGGCVAAEVAGIPHVVCGPLFAFWLGAWHGASGEVDMPNLDDVRRRHGLAPDPELEMLHRYLNLAFLPPAFPDPSLELPSTVQFLRPVCFNQTGSERLPNWINRLSGKRPVVHASLGTVFHRTPGVFSAIIEGLREEAVDLILAVGRDQDPEAFGPLPPNIYVERYIPHTLLLPYCDIVITHGGFSSVMACFNAGIPMVVIPLAGGDQPGNAARCAAMGVARVVRADERTPEKIRDAVREVLRDSRYRENARQLQQEIHALPPPEHAVALLERLNRERAPICNETHLKATNLQERPDRT